jgi:hypothetical protein
VLVRKLVEAVQAMYCIAAKVAVLLAAEISQEHSVYSVRRSAAVDAH